MNMNELQRKYPAVYSEAVAQGIEHGVQLMRKRVCAVLPLTSTNKRTLYSIKCIKDGTGLGAKVMATYGVLQIEEYRNNRRKENHDTLLAAALEEALNVGKSG